MSAKQLKKSNTRSLLSLFFRKTSTKPTNVIKLHTKTITNSEKSTMEDSELELVNKYFSNEPLGTSLESVEYILVLQKSHIERLSREQPKLDDMNNMNIDIHGSELGIILKRWGKSIKNSAENLEETLERFYKENFEPTACFHLNRSIVHLINLYETISEISKLPHNTYDVSMYTYLNIMRNCVIDFRTDFIKFCREISNYITDLKQTLTLLINRHPENRLVIHAMGDIEKLYNFALETTNKINTGTPIDLNASISYIDIISNDINDIKSDLINVKHHQDKDKKYVTSSYV